MRHVIQSENGIMKHINVNIKIVIYLKSIADTSVVKCGEFITAMNIVSTKMTNTITTNVTSTASRNCHCKRVRDCYNLHTVLLAIILILVIIIICYFYAKKR